ncbi:MAG: hypothetical protein ACPG8W_00930 [Candidatus Promineifilaceae bacterium]
MSAIRSDHAPRTIWGTQAAPRRAAQQSTTKSNTLLWIVSLLSLTLNVFIIVGFVLARGLLGNMVATTNHELYTSLKTLETYSAAEIPIQMQQSAEVLVTEPIRIQESVSIPVSTAVEIDQTLQFQQEVVVPVRQTIPVNQTAYAPISVMGVSSSIAVPIAFEIPVSFDMVVPIDVAIPFQANVPIETEVPFELNKEIPLPVMTVEVEMNDTIELPVTDILEETSLTSSLNGIHKILNVIENVMFIPLPSK